MISDFLDEPSRSGMEAALRSGKISRELHNLVVSHRLQYGEWIDEWTSTGSTCMDAQTFKSERQSRWLSTRKQTLTTATEGGLRYARQCESPQQRENTLNQKDLHFSCNKARMQNMRPRQSLTVCPSLTIGWAVSCTHVDLQRVNNEKRNRNTKNIAGGGEQPKTCTRCQLIDTIGLSDRLNNWLENWT